MFGRLEQMRQETEKIMLAEMGTAHLCQLHKDGQVTGGLKYQEGRLVALGEVMRLLQQCATHEIGAILDVEEAKWQAQLQHYKAADHPVISWIVYCQGGADVIQEIRLFIL